VPREYQNTPTHPLSFRNVHACGAAVLQVHAFELFRGSTCLRTCVANDRMDSAAQEQENGMTKTCSRSSTLLGRHMEWTEESRDSACTMHHPFRAASTPIPTILRRTAVVSDVIAKRVLTIAYSSFCPRRGADTIAVESSCKQSVTSFAKRLVLGIATCTLVYIHVRKHKQALAKMFLIN
jgi:hypothetical protein